MDQLTRRPDWKDRLKKWIPVALWVSFIFLFSSGNFSSPNTSQVLGPLLQWILPAISAQQIEAIHFFIRKFAHWGEYFVLGALTLRALGNHLMRTWESRHVVWTVLFVLVLATIDEFHQSFVPTRTASVSDVMIDLFGGTCGALWMYLRDGNKSNSKKT